MVRWACAVGARRLALAALVAPRTFPPSPTPVARRQRRRRCRRARQAGHAPTIPPPCSPPASCLAAVRPVPPKQTCAPPLWRRRLARVRCGAWRRALEVRPAKTHAVSTIKMHPPPTPKERTQRKNGGAQYLRSCLNLNLDVTLKRRYVLHFDDVSEPYFRGSEDAIDVPETGRRAVDARGRELAREGSVGGGIRAMRVLLRYSAPCDVGGEHSPSPGALGRSGARPTTSYLCLQRRDPHSPPVPSSSCCRCLGTSS